MKTRTSRFVVFALFTAMFAGAVCSLEPATIVNASGQFAQRYHQRSRTSNFYRRATGTRTSSRGLFGR